MTQTLAADALHAYLGRIGLTAPPAATAEGLNQVLRAHRQAIAFENLDICLGRGISLAPDAVFDKLVTRRRGGYCFEQNQLFARALRALDFPVRPLLARVWLAGPDTPPRTHALLLTEIGGEHWIADAGFGDGFTPAMPLIDGAEAASGFGVLHRLIRDARGWVLQRDGGPAEGNKGWLDQYSFTLRRVFAADLEQANHWTATHPSARHVTQHILGRVLPDGRISLVERQFTALRAGEKVARTITDAADYARTLRDQFGIALEDAEIAALPLFRTSG